MGSAALRCLRGLAEAQAETENDRTAADEDEEAAAAALLDAVLKDEPRPVASDIVEKSSG